jgi:PKD repeat protein
VHPDSLSGPHNWLVYVDNQPNYVTYHWNWGDGTSSYSAFPSHTYTAAASYNICLTITDNCGDSATVCQTDSLYRTSSSTMVGVTVQPLNVGTSGIPYLSLGSINVYPVPATENLVIENLQKQGRADLYDNEGRKVLSEPISEKHAQINIKDLAPGFYLMKVYSGNDIWLKKIIKQ